MTGLQVKPDWMEQSRYDRLKNTPHKQLTRNERILRNALTITVLGPILKPWEEGRKF